MRAARWYRKAAAQGHIDAQYFLGIMCENGEGVKKSTQVAARWYALAAKGYAKAAKQGDEDAQPGDDELPPSPPPQITGSAGGASDSAALMKALRATEQMRKKAELAEAKVKHEQEARAALEEQLAAAAKREAELRAELSSTAAELQAMRALSPRSGRGGSGRRPVANRHARQSLSPQPLPVSPRVRRRRKQPAAKKAPSSLPPGWFGGKLDDGTAFWYHEDDPGDVRFEWPESDSPKASKPERSKPGIRRLRRRRFCASATERLSPKRPTRRSSVLSAWSLTVRPRRVCGCRAS